jgi:hypothetical protein
LAVKKPLPIFLCGTLHNSINRRHAVIEHAADALWRGDFVTTDPLT